MRAPQTDRMPVPPCKYARFEYGGLPVHWLPWRSPPATRNPLDRSGSPPSSPTAAPEGVVPRTAGRNVGQADLAIAEPLQRLRNQLRAVVHPQHPRWAARRSEHVLELGDEALGGDRALHQMQQRNPGVLVDHRGDLDRLAVDGGVELEVDRPHHVRRVGGDRWDRGHPGPFAWAVHPHLQALLTPEPVDLLLVDLTALVVAQRRPRTPEPMARVFRGVRTQPGPQIRVRVGRGRRD